MKKQNFPIEKYYIPLGLFLLNCCVVHFIFVLFAGGLYPVLYKAAIGAAGLALTFFIIVKRKWGILLASLFYLLLLL